MADAQPIEDLTGQVRGATEAAVASAWAFFVRTAQQGLDWEDIHGCQGVADYRARLAAEPGLLLETCQALLEYDSGLTAEERADCRRVVAIADALALRHPATANSPAVPVTEPAFASDLTGPSAAAPGPWVESEDEAPGPVRRGRAGRWIAAMLLALGTAAALFWLWNQQSGPRPPHPVASAKPTAIATPLAPAAPQGTAAAVPAPQPSAVEPASKPSPRSAPGTSAVATTKAAPIASAAPNVSAGRPDRASPAAAPQPPRSAVPGAIPTSASPPRISAPSPGPEAAPAPPAAAPASPAG